ncbi:MAG: hypothetical protein JWM80_1190 [Cyanobacteria bacterium RYN_339]|nr:hypothetical protein [Cyanobacteria bacterium RYN_339]
MGEQAGSGYSGAAEAPALGGERAARVHVETFAGDGTEGFTDGESRSARFNLPWGLACDANGNLYVADSGNHCIRKITPEGLVTTLAGAGTAGHADGEGQAARFNYPRGVAVDAVGNVYVADTCNDRIRKITPQGVVTTLSGEGVRGFANGARAAARFNLPNGLAVDAAGWVYVADTANMQVRKVSPGGTVSTFAGEGVAGFADGPARDARFSSPRAVAIDAAGVLYVADVGNSRVRKVARDGHVFPLAGNGQGRLLDGPGPHTSFREPCGVAVDEEGAVYVADTDNHCIRLIGPDAMVETLTGDGRGVADYADGSAAAARFSTPTGLCIGPLGEVYVGDARNHCIRRILLG